MTQSTDLLIQMAKLGLAGQTILIVSSPIQQALS